MSQRREEDDPVVYRIEYSLLAQELHRATLGHDGNDAPRTKLSVEALELIESTAKELRRLGWRWVGTGPSRLVRWMRRRRGTEYVKLGAFLDTELEPATVVLHWSCRVIEGDWEWAERALAGCLPKLPGGRRNVITRLMIASRRRRLRLRQVDRRRLNLRRRHEDEAWLEDYLAVLAAPHSWRRPPVGRLLIKLGLSRLRPVPTPTYRVHYNLACLYSRLATRRTAADPQGKKHLDDALAQWKMCLGVATSRQEETLREWAAKDPGLKALRDAGRLGESPTDGLKPWPRRRN
jgi:hypothetical protein